MKVTPFENDCGLYFSGTAFKISCERWEVRRLVDEMQRHINRWDKKQAPALPEPMREDKHWQTIEKLRRAYHLARNAAIGLSNYCEESASTRACGKELIQAEELYRSIDFDWWNEAVGRAEARKD